MKERNSMELDNKLHVGNLYGHRDDISLEDLKNECELNAFESQSPE